MKVDKECRKSGSPNAGFKAWEWKGRGPTIGSFIRNLEGLNLSQVPTSM